MVPSTTEWPRFPTRRPCRGKTLLVDKRSCSGRSGARRGSCQLPLMCRALKPKLAFRKEYQSCGGAQTQASGFKPEVFDCSSFTLVEDCPWPDADGQEQPEDAERYSVLIQ